MGPASRSIKALSPSDPPFFNPNGDLQEYRRDVSRCVDTVSAAARKETDCTYQTVFATLARQLYTRGLYETQAKGLINHKKDNHTQAIKEIVELVAVDPPIAVVSRLTSSFNRVTNCHRHKGESLSSFVSRFRGLATDYLLHLGLSASSQASEVLAITLLNNANLSDETLTNVKLLLIALAQAREKVVHNDTLSVKREGYEALKRVVVQFSKLTEEPPMRLLRKDTADSLNLKVLVCRRRVEVLTKTLSNSMDALAADVEEPSSFEEVLLKTVPRCKLNLDDAVTMIRNLSFNSKNQGQTYTKAEIYNIVGQKVQSALLAFTRQNPKPNQPPSSSKGLVDTRSVSRRSNRRQTLSRDRTIK